jgi:hypothetical protein
MSDEQESTGQGGRGRATRSLVLAVVTLVTGLAAIVLASRRGGDATIEPPF